MALCMVHVSDMLTTGSRRASVTQHMCLDIIDIRKARGGSAVQAGIHRGSWGMHLEGRD